MWDGNLETTSVPKHRINLEPSNPALIYAAFNRFDPCQRVIERGEVDQMLKAGVVEPATREWPSPVVFVTKKNGFLGFCVY